MTTEITPLQYLKKSEWTMGNGQCRKCCGLSPNFFDMETRFNGYEWVEAPTEEEKKSLIRDVVGHSPECELAAVLKSLGDHPVVLRTVYRKKTQFDRRLQAQWDEISGDPK